MTGLILMKTQTGRPGSRLLFKDLLPILTNQQVGPFTMKIREDLKL